MGKTLGRLWGCAPWGPLRSWAGAEQKPLPFCCFGLQDPPPRWSLRHFLPCALKRSCLCALLSWHPQIPPGLALSVLRAPVQRDHILLSKAAPPLPPSRGSQAPGAVFSLAFHRHRSFRRKRTGLLFVHLVSRAVAGILRVL